MLTQSWHVLKASFEAWQDDEGGRLGAALAFYTALSLAPFFIFSVSAASLVLEREAVQAQVLHQVEDLVGLPGVQITEMLFSTALQAYASRSGIFATGIGVVVLLMASSAVLHELRDALNLIFDAVPEPERPLLHAVLSRFVSLALVLSLGFLLVVSLLFSASLTTFTGALTTRLNLPTLLLTLLDIFVNVTLLSAIFALLYKYLPNVKLGWREVWAGALLTASVFTAGKWSIGLFLGRSVVASAYGAAGALVVFLLWVFFSAQLFFFGAEFVKVVGEHRRARADSA